MRIRVRLFAMHRERLGRRELEFALAEGGTVGDAWRELCATHPVLAASTGSVRFARNGRYAGEAEPLADGDELALIPPVAGGADEDGGGTDAAGGEPPPLPRFAVSAEPIAPGTEDALRRLVAGDGDGAVVLFVGQTRRTPGTPAPGEEGVAARFAGAPVEELEYEAFESLALDVFADLEREATARFGCSALAIHHRTGVVRVGEVSVLIAAAAPHREGAFAACRYAIEELKARAPIWKSERFADGRVWLGAPARSGPRDEVQGADDAAATGS